MYTCKGVFHTKNGEIVEKKIVSALFGTLPKNSRFRLIIEEFQERSTPLNDYYWVLCSDYILPAMRDAGHEKIKNKVDVDKFLKEHFRVKSTQAMNDKEMHEYIEDIYRWAAEYLNVALPSPKRKDIKV